MGKVLADTTPEAKDLFDRRACRGGGGIVDKVAEDAVGQFDDGICPRTSCRKRLRGPAGKRLEGADQRLLKAELLRLEGIRPRSSLEVVAEQFPVSCRQHLPRTWRAHLHAAAARDGQLLVGLLDREVANRVAKGVGVGG